MKQLLLFIWSYPLYLLIESLYWIVLARQLFQGTVQYSWVLLVVLEINAWR